MQIFERGSQCRETGDFKPDFDPLSGNEELQGLRDRFGGISPRRWREGEFVRRLAALSRDRAIDRIFMGGSHAHGPRQDVAYTVPTRDGPVRCSKSAPQVQDLGRINQSSHHRLCWPVVEQQASRFPKGPDQADSRRQRLPGGVAAAPK